MEQPDPNDPPVSLSSAAAEAIELLDTGEKILLFREPSDPKLALHNFPRKKKKNFLNSKKAARASVNSQEQLPFRVSIREEEGISNSVK